MLPLPPDLRRHPSGPSPTKTLTPGSPWHAPPPSPPSPARPFLPRWCSFCRLTVRSLPKTEAGGGVGLGSGNEVALRGGWGSSAWTGTQTRNGKDRFGRSRVTVVSMRRSLIRSLGSVRPPTATSRRLSPRVATPALIVGQETRRPVAESRCPGEIGTNKTGVVVDDTPRYQQRWAGGMICFSEPLSILPCCCRAAISPHGVELNRGLPVQQ